jgi:mono/diheme cytochrome c family protein
MMRIFSRLLMAAAVGVAAFWFLTAPGSLRPLPAVSVEPDPANGEIVFHAGGCASCHGAGLEGGLEMTTAYGLFRVPNISPDPEAGIGDWSRDDFIRAMKEGVSPEGRHYYPAFPYLSYTRADQRDLLDLKAYLDTFPPSPNRVADHEVHFPWNIRRGIGLWKLRYRDTRPVLVIDSGDIELRRGRYLVEALGHCAECHTPRDRFGGLDRSRWMAGGPSPDGEGSVPNITPHEQGIGGWSQRDIAYYLETGFTPDFDTAGGSMVEVQENMARLGSEDLEAIALYLKSIPGRPDSGN